MRLCNSEKERIEAWDQNIHELKRFLKTEKGKALLQESTEKVLSFIASYGMEVVKDPDVFLALSIAEKYGLLLHDAKIIGSMIENWITKLATLDKDFQGIPIIELLELKEE
ncbi:type II toxin-antitoxin system VapC family toxin [Thermococcus sp.]